VKHGLEGNGTSDCFKGLANSIRNALPMVFSARPKRSFTLGLMISPWRALTGASLPSSSRSYAMKTQPHPLQPWRRGGGWSFGNTSQQSLGS